MSEDRKDLMDGWKKSGLKIRGSSANSTRRRDSVEVHSDSDEDLDIREARCEANRRKIGIIWNQNVPRKITVNDENEVQFKKNWNRPRVCYCLNGPMVFAVLY